MLSKYEIFSCAISNLYHDIQHLERTQMEKYGLKGPHAQCLVILSRYPQGLPAARLCEVSEKDKASISRTRAELERAGLVTRDGEGGSRYRAPLLLTPAGREAAQSVNALAAQAVEQAGAGLTDWQRENFYQVLGMIAGNLHTISREGLQNKEEPCR